MERNKVSGFVGRTGRGVRILAALGLAATIMVGSIGKASAFQVVNNNSVGLVTAGPAIGNGQNYVQSENYVRGPWTQVSRTPYGGTQRITVQWRLWVMISGRFSVATEASQSYLVAGGSVTNPGWYYRTTGGTFMSQTIVTWQTQSGAYLGSKTMTYTAMNDYSCGRESAPYCWVVGLGSGWYGVQVG